MPPHITAVHLSPTHSFSKMPQPHITLLAGQGVQGDAHCGALVQHRYLVRKDPTQPNLCQVHLLQHELLDGLNATLHHAPGHLTPAHITPGQLGENITTRGLDLLTLPTGTLLTLGDTAVLQVTGLRSPCHQLNRLQPGLMQACFTSKSKSKSNPKSPRAGIMAIVLRGGLVRPNDPIHITLPPEPHQSLTCV